MNQVYKIAENQLSAAAGRTIKIALKLMIIVYIAFVVYMAWRLGLSWKYILMGAGVSIPGYGLALLIGYAILKQRFRRYRIVLDDEGIEFYMPPNDKKIKWENVLKDQKKDGTIAIRDKHRSAMARWLTGEGSLQIIPELERFDELNATLNTYISKFSH